MICFFLVIDRNVSEMTEKKVISVRMFENIGQWTLLRRVLIQPRGQMTEMFQWPKRFSKIDWSVSVKKNPDYDEAHDKRWRSRWWKMTNHMTDEPETHVFGRNKHKRCWIVRRRHNYNTEKSRSGEKQLFRNLRHKEPGTEEGPIRTTASGGSFHRLTASARLQASRDLGTENEVAWHASETDCAIALMQGILMKMSSCFSISYIRCTVGI